MCHSKHIVSSLVSANFIRKAVFYLVPMILSLSVHEFAHAWVATKLGDETPEKEERLTLSPLSHIDIWGTLVIPLMSIAFSGVAYIGWAKPVQVNPSRFTRKVSMRTGMALTAVAGPLSNFMLAFASVGILTLCFRFGWLSTVSRNQVAIIELLKTMFFVNVGLCVFNLLPIPPLDGSRLLPRSLDNLVESMGNFSFLLIMVVLSIPAIRLILIDLPMRWLTHAILAVFGLAQLSPKGIRVGTASKPISDTDFELIASDESESVSIEKHVYSVRLPQFEGPLDLLLHLIQTHELNIIDIPISFVTTKYLEYLSMMQALSIDVASEYLVMAAVLTHIKSKMLLPQNPNNQEDGLDEDELDPRGDLVRRLLVYQTYKNAAQQLEQRHILGTDVFARPPAAPPPKSEVPLAQISVFQLMEAFQNLLERRKISHNHEVMFERITIHERIQEIVLQLEQKTRVVFEDLFPEEMTRFDLVITFLALLEMSRLKMTHLFQTDVYSPIHIEYAGPPPDLDLQSLLEHDAALLEPQQTANANARRKKASKALPPTAASDTGDVRNEPPLPSPEPQPDKRST
jgi:segregation and condensation protein A